MNFLAIFSFNKLPDKIVKLQGQLLIFHITTAGKQRCVLAASLAFQNKLVSATPIILVEPLTSFYTAATLKTKKPTPLLKKLP